MKKEFSLASIFNDNMVFQINKPIRVFGKCKKGIDLNIEFLEQSLSLKTQADHFLFELDSEGLRDKSFSFRIYSKKQSETIYNCRMGNVFLITGGENVKMPLSKTFYSDEKKGDYDIRFLQFNHIQKVEEENKKSKLKKQKGIVEEEKQIWVQYDENDREKLSALAVLFSKHSYEITKEPMGIITISNEETSIFSWMSQSDISANKEITEFLANQKHRLILYKYKPHYIFDKYIKNLAPFALSAIIFYQGETDYQIQNLYEKAFKQITRSYRIEFKDHILPFIVTQIAGFDYSEATDEQIGEFRQTQLNLFNEKSRVFIVSAIDLGEEKNITPINKVVLANRLSKLVIEKVFKKGKNNASPMYFSYQKQADSLVINTYGNYLNLMSKSKNNLGFSYSEDGVTFIDAKEVELRGSQIILKGAEKAREIRYCYSKFPYCDIYTTSNLPLLPFKATIN